MKEKELWQIDSGYACAGVFVDPESRKIIETAPIFKVLLGQTIEKVGYKKIKIERR